MKKKKRWKVSWGWSISIDLLFIFLFHLIRERKRRNSGSRGLTGCQKRKKMLWEEPMRSNILLQKIASMGSSLNIFSFLKRLSASRHHDNPVVKPLLKEKRMSRASADAMNWLIFLFSFIRERLTVTGLLFLLQKKKKKEKFNGGLRRLRRN